MTFACCTTCYEMLQQIGTIEAQVWVKICGGYVENGVLYFQHEHHSLKVLETNGFIISTDCEHGIKVLPLGVGTIGSGDTCFCPKFGKH